MDKNLFDTLIDSVNEMVAIENDEIQPNPENVHRHSIPDVKSIRKRFSMSQAEFAQMLGASPSVVQSWELERRVPSGMAMKMLSLIEKDPSVVETLRAI